jgi:hypothetical protein
MPGLCPGGGQSSGCADDIVEAVWCGEKKFFQIFEYKVRILKKFSFCEIFYFS